MSANTEKKNTRAVLFPTHIFCVHDNAKERLRTPKLFDLVIIEKPINISFISQRL